MVKKIISLSAVVLLIFSFMCVPASASYSGTTDVFVAHTNASGAGHASVAHPSIPTSGYTYEFPAGYNGFRVSYSSVPGKSFNTVVGYYISYYFRSGGAYTWTNSPAVTQPSSYQATYVNDAGATGTVTSVDVKSFTPAKSDLYSNSIGVTLKTDFAGSEEHPIHSLKVSTVPTSYMYNIDAGANTLSTLVITSYKVVDAKDQATLDALEGVVEAIVAQSDILTAMYGDVMEVLNAIYQRTGDMLYAQELANNYFQTMIQYLSSIDMHSANIYSLLQNQFQLLIATIQTESNDIQVAIRNQTDELISYFERTFNSAVGTLPDDNESTQGVIDNAHQNDEEYTADALGKFQEISAAFNGFDGGLGSGVAVASTLFSRVWSAMGDYVIVYTFPLMLALSLVVVGRLSRVHSDGSGNKGKGGEDNG